MKENNESFLPYWIIACEKCGRKILLNYASIGTTHQFPGEGICFNCINLKDFHVIKYLEHYPELKEKIEKERRNKHARRKRKLA